MYHVLSVIIPVYNGEKYVRRAVESVLHQPESHLIEVLIINDGSKDNSGSVCDQLADEYENVRVIHKENGGVSSARNLGIEHVNGKYVGFLDCDDWWEPEVFDHALAEEMLSKDSVDVYQFSFREVNNNVSLEKRYILEDKTMTYENSGFGRYDWSPHCSFFYLRTLLLDHDIRYLMSKVGEDGPVVEMALYHARSLKQSHRVLFTYWENYASCVHTTDVLHSLNEQCKGIEQRKAYYEKFGVEIDEDTEKVWQILTSLPKICAKKPYGTVKLFMEEHCLNILARRPDICFGEHLWSRVDAWRTRPVCYWLMQKIKIGFPLCVKNILLSVPGIGQWTNYFYTRCHRKFTPTVK